MQTLNEIMGLDDGVAKRAHEIHRRAIIIDASNVPIVDPWLETEISEGFFDNMLAGGVTASNVTVPHDVDESLGGSLQEFRMHREWVAAAPEKAKLIDTVADIRAAKAEGKAGIIIGPQSANMVGDTIEAIGVLRGAGVRILQLTYNARNLIGDGCLEAADGGLSDFGRAALREMNSLGILVDLSHCGDRTTSEAIAGSEKPVIFSHANARAIFNHPRNKTDDQIKALAERGGVMCLLPYNKFVGRLGGGSGVPTHEDFLRHVEHVYNLVGVDHVGLATDINDNNETRRIWFRRQHPESVGDPSHHNYPVGFDGDLSNFEFLTMALVSAGYSEDDILKMLGGNLERLFEQVW